MYFICFSSVVVYTHWSFTSESTMSASYVSLHWDATYSFLYNESQQRKQHLNTIALRHGEILCKIIFYRWNNCLHKFQEYYQIHVNTEHFATLFDCLNDFLHNIGMSEMQRKKKWSSVSTEKKNEEMIGFFYHVGLEFLAKWDVYILAWMHRCHIWSRQMWMRFHCNSFLGMILTNIFVHLFNT